MVTELMVIVPAAGNSVRFGEGTPKQFRRFSVSPGEPQRMMWENAVHGLRIAKRLLVGIRFDHELYGHAGWSQTLAEYVILDQSRGQADTILQVMQYAQHMTVNHTVTDEVLIVNCDNGFAPGVLDKLVAEGRHNQKPTAITIQAQPDEDNRWSFISDHPWFFFAAEKKPISKMALAGAYYFPHFQDLARALKIINERSGEPYLSMVYDHMAWEKCSLQIRRDDWYDWGTPEALTRFLGDR